MSVNLLSITACASVEILMPSIPRNQNGYISQKLNHESKIKPVFLTFANNLSFRIYHQWPTWIKSKIPRPEEKKTLHVRSLFFIAKTGQIRAARPLFPRPINPRSKTYEIAGPRDETKKDIASRRLIRHTDQHRSSHLTSIPKKKKN